MISSAETPGDVYLQLQKVEQFHACLIIYLQNPKLYPGYFYQMIESISSYKQSQDMQTLEKIFFLEECIRENMNQVEDGDGLFSYFKYFQTKYPSHISRIRVSHDAIDILKMAVLKKSQCAIFQLAYYILQGDVFKPDYLWISWALYFLKQGTKKSIHPHSAELFENIVIIQDRVLQGLSLRELKYSKLRPLAFNLMNNQLALESQFQEKMSLAIPRPSIYWSLSTIEEGQENEATYQL